MLKNKSPYFVHAVYFFAPFTIFCLSLLHKTTAILVFWITFYAFGLALSFFPFTLLILFLIAYYVDKREENNQKVISYLCFLVGLLISGCLFIAHLLSV